MPEGARVLDVGCGDGLVDSLMMKHRPDLKIAGVDVLTQPHALIPVTEFDGERLPFPDCFTNVVMFVDVLHHTNNPGALLREARRVARDLIVIKDHNHNGFMSGSTLRFMDWLGNSPYGITLTYNYWPKNQWARTFCELQLTPVSYRSDLYLYPSPMGWLFNRDLHFISVLKPGNAEEC
jgi:SAM-dependent methyltransferase